jgi:hypothetical protein
MLRFGQTQQFAYASSDNTVQKHRTGMMGKQVLLQEQLGQLGPLLAMQLQGLSCGRAVLIMPISTVEKFCFEAARWPSH